MRLGTGIALAMMVLPLHGLAGCSEPAPNRITAPSITPAAFRLTAGGGFVAPDGELSVSWATSAGGTKDRIALSRIDALPCVEFWSIATNGNPVGTATLRAPLETGRYEFRYLPNGGCDAIARSSPVVVSVYTLTTSVSSVARGAEVLVSWTASIGGARDWIGLFAKGDGSCNHWWWAYTGGATSGTYQVLAPPQPGQWEFRYYLDDGCDAPAQVSPLTVGTDGQSP